ncbi:MAG: HupE/UreJ family protein [Gemmatimonadaceae bacterium]|nr:HupE/UreJ family protein [Gemmatimonadaceae bacterium]
MISEWLAFLELGFRHIVAWDAADHILFLLVLAAIYRVPDWRAALWVISAFTVGHSISLLLAVTGALVLPSGVVEFLIPVTIVATGVENLILRERAASGRSARHRPLFAGLFGIVHGAGFAGYLQGLFMDHLAVPLLGFNLGIEAGQVVVLAVAAVGFAAADRLLAHVPAAGRGLPDAFQLRVVGVSALVTVVATAWAVARYPA